MDIKKWKVKTKDGNIYGPADTETIKGWIKENRISIEDDVSPADMEEWKKPAEINEFATASAIPATEVKTDFSLPPAQARTLTTQVVNDGWETLKANLWPIVGTSALYLIISILISSLPLIGVIAAHLIAGPLVVGWSWYCLCKIRKQEISPVALFDGFKIFLPALGAYLLITILTGLGYIALIVPGIILVSAYSLAYFFMVDKNMGPWQAMKASFDITKGYRWRVLAVMALCNLINILGLLCLGVGIFVTAPLTILALAALYQRLSAGNIHEYQKQTNVKEILLGVILPVVVIIGMLVIMMPALSKARDVAGQAVSASNMKQIGIALQMHANDYDDEFPPTLQHLYPQYINTSSVFWCPTDKDSSPTDINNNEVDGRNSARISYQYNSGHSISESPSIPLVWDNGCGGSLDNHKKGGNVLYLDGHVEWVPCEEWENPTHGETSYPGKP
ncbi:hypothetical protein KAS42_04175 [bacterium]|nr:hypothetical protein [bacterium]